MRQASAGRHERLRHHLAAERARRVLAWVLADECVVVDPFEVKYREQLFEIAKRHCGSPVT